MMSFWAGVVKGVLARCLGFSRGLVVRTCADKCSGLVGLGFHRK